MDPATTQHGLQPQFLHRPIAPELLPKQMPMVHAPPDRLQFLLPLCGSFTNAAQSAGRCTGQSLMSLQKIVGRPTHD